MAKFPRISSILAIVIAISSEVNSFTKYGRGCQDIGCLPNEVCTMAQDSCNLGQRDGKECGTYPTCKRTGAAKPADSNVQHRPTFNTNTNADNSSPYGGSSSGNVNTNSGLYPSLPNQNNMHGGNSYPGVNPGGYVPPGHNPSQGGYGTPGHNPSQGGYQPPQYGGGGGYQPQPPYNGGNNGNNGYNGGGGYNRGGYNNPTGPTGQNDKGGGFLSGILSNPHVSSAISGIIAGQIQKAITGGNKNDPHNQPNNAYGSGGYGGGGSSSGGSNPGGNIIGGLITSYLSGGGGGNSQPSRSGSNLGLLGDLLGGGGGSSNQRSGGGGISDFFSSKQLGGLFNENPKTSSSTYSSGKKNYPTQSPSYSYNQQNY